MGTLIRVKSNWTEWKQCNHSTHHLSTPKPLHLIVISKTHISYQYPNHYVGFSSPRPPKSTQMGFSSMWRHLKHVQDTLSLVRTTASYTLRILISEADTRFMYIVALLVGFTHIQIEGNYQLAI